MGALVIDDMTPADSIDNAEQSAMLHAPSPDVLLVTGLSGAGKSTALRALEDLGWEVVDNLPVSLIRRLFATSDAASGGAEGNPRPIAIGMDSRTRGFSADALVKIFKQLRGDEAREIGVLYLDCSAVELDRRFSETRRRHPLAGDRPIGDAVAREREIMDPLRRWAGAIIDTSTMTSQDLIGEIRRRFTFEDAPAMTLTVMSFGFARGQPQNADIVFDVRFLRNPYWDEGLRDHTGLEPAVAAYIQQDPAYAQTIAHLEALLGFAVPHYVASGRSYLTIAIGCTGGRHRSVHISETIAASLRADGYAPVVQHRNLASPLIDGLEARRVTK